MGVEEGGGVAGKITIGGCVMEKKVKSDPEVLFHFVTSRCPRKTFIHLIPLRNTRTINSLNFMC